MSLIECILSIAFDRYCHSCCPARQLKLPNSGSALLLVCIRHTHTHTHKHSHSRTKRRRRLMCISGVAKNSNGNEFDACSRYATTIYVNGIFFSVCVSDSQRVAQCFLATRFVKHYISTYTRRSYITIHRWNLSARDSTHAKKKPLAFTRICCIDLLYAQ